MTDAPNAAAEEGAKKANWLSKAGKAVFMHSDAKLAEIADRKNLAVGELKLFDRVSKIKTGAIIAGGVIVASVLAGIGNKGPGKHAEQEAGRGQDQQAAMGVA